MAKFMEFKSREGKTIINLGDISSIACRTAEEPGEPGTYVEVSLVSGGSICSEVMSSEAAAKVMEDIWKGMIIDKVTVSRFNEPRSTAEQ